VPPKLLLFVRWGVPAVVLALIVAAIYWNNRPVSPAEAQAAFHLPGPQGQPIVVQLPELASLPPLDLAAACATLAAHNAKAHALGGAAQADDDDEDPKLTVYGLAEAGCADAGKRGYRFFDQLADTLNADSGLNRFDTEQTLAAMRGALQTATSPEEVAATLAGIDTRATYMADRLHAPDFYLLGAEVMAVGATYCTGTDAASCRAKTHSKRGQDLSDAGRWRADADLLRAAIAAYREALRDTEPKSSLWIDLHTLTGSAFGQLSEQLDDQGKRASLREALNEYELARAAVKPSDDWTLALIDQNVCSIRQPFAAMDRDRVNTNLAIEECEKARVFYAARGEMTNEAAAHYNEARALERLAEWDQDEAPQMRAVEHVRRTVQLYADDHAVLSQAFGQVHLAEALIGAADFAAKAAGETAQGKSAENVGETARTNAPDNVRDNGEERSRALLAEARASLDAAEPVLRAAQARGYLERLDNARRRLGRAGSSG
jgi:hypothetical protein